MLPSIAISLGDINGVGMQLALENHKKISKLCNPIYCINKKIIKEASKTLNISIPKDFIISGKYKKTSIQPGKVKKDSGQFSYDSFLHAISLAQEKKVHAKKSLDCLKLIRIQSTSFRLPLVLLRWHARCRALAYSLR